MAPREELTPYEQRVWEHLRKRVRGGVVPAQALTTGPGEESKRWWRGFVNEVVDEAQERGFSRDLWPKRLALLVGVIASVPALLLGLAYGENAFYAYVVPPVAVIGRVLYGRRQRDTAAGLEAAARWRAVQAKLGEDPVFAEQPPHAVALWERLLAYGAALGSRPGGDPADTHGLRAGEPGLEHVRRALAPGGRALPPRAAVGTAPWLGAAGAAGSARGRPVLPCDRGVGALGRARRRGWDRAPHPHRSDRGACRDRRRGCLARAAGGADLFKSKEVTGEIVRLRTTQSEGETTGHWSQSTTALRTEVRAWSVRPEIYAGLEQGQIVTVRVTPRLGYVHSIEPEPA